MSKILLPIFFLAASFMIDVEAIATQPSLAARPVAWRGGYRWRSYSYRGGNYGGSNYGYRGGNYGKSSALDYPPWTQPTISRMHQWNKYPNQPYYLRGERKSLGILP